ncbi:Fc receptor-like protein 3 isoform X3 [Prinia subflava]|uniref:Fc receptor-like protein 3 isoform X3 n=1 Tax=Prinia subflava TaxID=208062 RepID=UPI002FE16E0F
MAGDTGMARKVALLLWAQTLGLSGTQTTQLLVQPPWTPAVLWDQVTLTCQGLGTTGATTWYKDGQQWEQNRRDYVTVTESGTYTCDRPASGRSPPVTILDELFSVPVLEGPPEVTEGSPLNLSCRSTPSPLRPGAPLLHLFYRDGQLVGGPQWSRELLVPAVGVSHSGNYSCQVRSEGGTVQKSSARLGITVRRVPLSGVSLLTQPPGGQVALGDRLVLSCAVAAGTGPLSFTWHRGGSGAPLSSGPHLELWNIGDSDSGHYHCRVSDGNSVAESVPLNVTVLVPVANATITPGPLSHQVHTGDPVTLRCSVQVGSAPVTFTWLHNGQEVARGPVLELGNVTVGHSGTYQCVATNQLGQDGHRVFQALSPELALEVTPQGHWNTAVATGVGGSFLFLVLLVGGVFGWRWWNHMAARKQQERVPPDPPAPPEEGEVLYTHVVSTKQMGVSPRATTLQDPRVTYAELRGPHGRLQELSDIHRNML